MPCLLNSKKNHFKSVILCSNKLSIKYEGRSESIFHMYKIIKYLLPLEPFSGATTRWRESQKWEPGNSGSAAGLPHSESHDEE